MDFKLRFTFKAEAGQFPRELIEAEGASGADAAVVIALVYPPDGKLGVGFISADGRNGAAPLAPIELFKAWLMFTAHIGELGDLEPSRRAFAADVFNRFTAAVPKPKPGPDAETK